LYISIIYCNCSNLTANCIEQIMVPCLSIKVTVYSQERGRTLNPQGKKIIINRKINWHYHQYYCIINQRKKFTDQSCPAGAIIIIIIIIDNTTHRSYNRTRDPQVVNINNRPFTLCLQERQLIQFINHRPPTAAIIEPLHHPDRHSFNRKEFPKSS